MAALLAVGAVILVWPGARAAVATLAREGIEWLRTAGPGVFFVAMALLPALGFPMAAFVVAAGPAFGPTLGSGTVALCALAATAANVSLSYALARWWLRGPVERLLSWLGYRLPVIPAGAHWQTAFLVRLLPGPPFWTQSYALGLLRLPFVAYLVASVVVPAVYIGGMIFGGDALWRGERKAALLAFAAVGAFACGLALLRRLRAKGVVPRANGAERPPGAS